jgi:hypothetical protein
MTTTATTSTPSTTSTMNKSSSSILQQLGTHRLSEEQCRSAFEISDTDGDGILQEYEALDALRALCTGDREQEVLAIFTHHHHHHHQQQQQHRIGGGGGGGVAIASSLSLTQLATITYEEFLLICGHSLLLSNEELRSVDRCHEGLDHIISYTHLTYLMIQSWISLPSYLTQLSNAYQIIPFHNGPKSNNSQLQQFRILTNQWKLCTIADNDEEEMMLPTNLVHATQQFLYQITRDMTQTLFSADTIIPNIQVMEEEYHILRDKYFPTNPLPNNNHNHNNNDDELDENNNSNNNPSLSGLLYYHLQTTHRHANKDTTVSATTNTIHKQQHHPIYSISFSHVMTYWIQSFLQIIIQRIYALLLADLSLLSTHFQKLTSQTSHEVLEELVTLPLQLLSTKHLQYLIVKHPSPSPSPAGGIVAAPPVTSSVIPPVIPAIEENSNDNTAEGETVSASTTTTTVATTVSAPTVATTTLATTTTANPYSKANIALNTILRTCQLQIDDNLLQCLVDLMIINHPQQHTLTATFSTLYFTPLQSHCESLIDPIIYELISNRLFKEMIPEMIHHMHLFSILHFHLKSPSTSISTSRMTTTVAGVGVAGISPISAITSTSTSTSNNSNRAEEIISRLFVAPAISTTINHSSDETNTSTTTGTTSSSNNNNNNNKRKTNMMQTPRIGLLPLALPTMAATTAAAAAATTNTAHTTTAHPSQVKTAKMINNKETTSNNNNNNNNTAATKSVVSKWW